MTLYDRYSIQIRSSFIWTRETTGSEARVWPEALIHRNTKYSVPTFDLRL
jgi:hypothetical protein